MDPVDIMTIHQEDVLKDPYNPPCLSRYMERGNYVDKDGEWWAHYCGSGVCPRAKECHNLTSKGHDHDSNK